MLRIYTCLIFISWLVCSCLNPQKKPVDKALVGTVPLNIERSKVKIDTSRRPKPVMGYRFVITGDFNGDARQDTLTEHFVSGINNEETNKFYDNIDYNGMVDSITWKKPLSLIKCKNGSIGDLKVATGNNFGLIFLKNEGDLNGDGSDEISYVIDHADWSSLNSYTIMTFTGHKWQRLYTFPIWEWQLPPLPVTQGQYGLFGLEKKVIVKNDTLNMRIERELKAFKGLIQKVADNKIRITYRDDMADGTKLVSLKRLKR